MPTTSPALSQARAVLRALVQDLASAVDTRRDLLEVLPHGASPDECAAFQQACNNAQAYLERAEQALALLEHEQQ